MSKTQWASKSGNIDSDWEVKSDEFELLKEDGYNFILEDESGYILKEDKFQVAEWEAKDEL